MSEEETYPIIPLVGSEVWTHAYDTGRRMEQLFPDQECQDFAYAVEYNHMGPLAEHALTGLKCLQVGERDEGSWIWRVELDDGSTWFMEGGCDYTGWDCRSYNDWFRLHEH